ncbi:hypothetical protein ACIFOE_08760 [Paenibacillus sp. NRS-1783]|jgi:hypothetical protein|uniref:hypothetical protein n=1 Tax=unclassified Paenibacillus TaxID=185978 RepID=UPI003D286E31
MKKKRAIFSVLSLSLALATGLTTSAVHASGEESVTESNAVVTKSSEPTTNTIGNITPFEIGNSFGTNISGSPTAESGFNVPAGYGHVKIYVKNLSSSPVKVTVRHESGVEYFSKTVSKGSPLTWVSFNEGYSQGVRTGKYTITFSGGSSNVDVSYNGIATNSKGDINL